MLTETQQLYLQWFLIFVIVYCLVRLTWISVNYILDKRAYDAYVEEFFNKIEEHRNVFDDPSK